MADNEERDTRGPIATTFGNPMVVRRVNGKEINVPLVKMAERYAHKDHDDEYLDDVHNADFDRSLGNAGQTGFGSWAASQRRGGTGAGPDVTTDYTRYNSYDIGATGGGGQSVSQTHYADGDNDSDLYGQPARPQHRQELYDDAGDADDSRSRDPDHMELDFMDNNSMSPTVDPKLRRGTFAKRKF